MKIQLLSTNNSINCEENTEIISEMTVMESKMRQYIRSFFCNKMFRFPLPDRLMFPKCKTIPIHGPTNENSKELRKSSYPM